MYVVHVESQWNYGFDTSSKLIILIICNDNFYNIIPTIMVSDSPNRNGKRVSPDVLCPPLGMQNLRWLLLLLPMNRVKTLRILSCKTLYDRTLPPFVVPLLIGHLRAVWYPILLRGSYEPVNPSGLTKSYPECQPSCVGLWGEGGEGWFGNCPRVE